MAAVPKPTPQPKTYKPLRSVPHPIPTHVKEEVFARDDYTCQWCRVMGGALDCHHRYRRGQGGRDAAFLCVTTHRLCHDYIHDHPEEARRRKFLVRSEAECAEPWT